VFVVAGSIGFLFALGVGIYILKNARELSESTYHASGDALVPGFWLWVYRIVGIWAFGFAGFTLYAIINSLLFLDGF
jgi:hypothetical protein